eukprot:CAMPEP_0184677716 /NCGR_PEP_ID=MMETSP0312-20130426/301_1 /TAXON_ID=31354 /ORGANISM="Compsopogon coeruleus, Strain SAG 36.94" /LENGTH=153 /DNA_ID=CAMNT_0027125743 /DNA_START=1696 /DNA_END=2158 /DNA_ORIENTATION=-
MGATTSQSRMEQQQRKEQHSRGAASNHCPLHRFRSEEACLAHVAFDQSPPQGVGYSPHWGCHLREHRDSQVVGLLLDQAVDRHFLRRHTPPLEGPDSCHLQDIARDIAPGVEEVDSPTEGTDYNLYVESGCTPLQSPHSPVDKPHWMGLIRSH